MAFFDWRDEELFDEALETVDPLKITFRNRPAIVIGPVEVRHMSMQQFAEVVRRDDDRFCATDAGHNLEGKCAEIEKVCGQTAGYFILGLARLDLADEPTYRALMKAFEVRRERFSKWIPHIELDSSNA